MVKKKEMRFVLYFILSVMISPIVFAHCQIPCGIFDDALRIKMMSESIYTIEKSMNEINTLSKQNPINYNQLVRWIKNKEEHGDEISRLVYFYFMAQRLIPIPKKDSQEYDKYRTQLELLHQILVKAGEAKQTTDLGVVKTLRELLKKFEDAYPMKKTYPDQPEK